MFQGPKTLKALNYEPFPFDPATIDAVILTHAHIDHSGLLPKLVRGGFSGPVFATAATRDLCAVMLADAADLQAMDVENLNRRNERRGLPAVTPIYGPADVAPTLRLFETAKLRQPVTVAPGVEACFWPAGHLLGAASVELVLSSTPQATRVMFSGDVGALGQHLLPAPDGPATTQHVVLESTYGDRERPALEPGRRRDVLTEELRRARAAGGPLLLPVFAIGRAQELLLDLLLVMEANPDLAGEVFLDSPLAVEATEVFLKRGWNPDIHSNPYLPLLYAERIHELLRPQESDTLDRLRGWHVILAGSGMCDGGRVRRHLKRLLWRKEATVLMTGHQAVGTLGRVLLEGQNLVRIQGQDVRVRATIRSIDAYSGHADASGLVQWLLNRAPTGTVFLNHGEPDGLAGLARRLEAAAVPPNRILTPVLDQSYDLAAGEVQAETASRPRLPPGAAGRQDWHNRRASFLGLLNDVLQEIGDNEARARLLAELTRQVKAARGQANGESAGATPSPPP
ncbi:MAG: MBL fold metallo-hydrolase [Brevundimonas sp.]